jgi:hypothetical protein
MVEVLSFRLDSCKMDCNSLDNTILVCGAATHRLGSIVCFVLAISSTACCILLPSNGGDSGEMDMRLAGNSKMLLPHETVADAPIISRV